MTRDVNQGPDGKLYVAVEAGDIRAPFSFDDLLTVNGAVAPTFSKLNEITSRISRVEAEVFWLDPNPGAPPIGDIFLALRILGPGSDGSSSILPMMIPVILRVTFPLGAFPTGIAGASVKGFYSTDKPWLVNASEGVQYALVSSAANDNQMFMLRIHYTYLGGDAPGFHSETSVR